MFDLVSRSRSSIPRYKNVLGYVTIYLSLDILFLSNHNIHKSLSGLCFWASDPLVDKFYKNLSIKGSEAQKQRPDELLWMLWFDKKVLPISKLILMMDSALKL